MTYILDFKMKSKLVTAYWMDVPGYPFQGASSIRKKRYLGSLISHCIGSKLPVVCYTHKISFDELNEIKENYKLNNLEIKILELTDIKFHNNINNIRSNKFDPNLDGRGTEIMWGKFDILERELDGFDNVYWVDAGLQHPGIFPWMFSKVHNKNLANFGIPNNWWDVLDVFNFSKFINHKFYDKLNVICKNKIMFVCSYGPQIGYPLQPNNIVDYLFSSPYPVGGMFGGNVKILKKYLNLFWSYAEKVLDKEILCTEEVLMKPAYDLMPEEELYTGIFDCFSSSIENHDEFHYEMWKPNKQTRKPFYMVWQEIKTKKL